MGHEVPWVIDCLEKSRMFRLEQLVSYDCYLVTHTMYLDGSDQFCYLSVHMPLKNLIVRKIILPLTISYMLFL